MCDVGCAVWVVEGVGCGVWDVNCELCGPPIFYMRQYDITPQGPKLLRCHLSVVVPSSATNFAALILGKMRQI